MSAVEKMNAWCDSFYESLAETLLEDELHTITPDRLGAAIGVNPKQLINAVWNGTMDIGWGHRGEIDSERRHTVFSKEKTWRYFYGENRSKGEIK